MPVVRSGLRKHLEERHISWITFSATVGFGLTIRSAQMLSLGGPLGICIIYACISILAWCVMGPFVEMSSVIPVNNGAYDLPGVFLCRRLGTALGFMFLFTYLMVYCDEVTMTSRIMDFCYPNDPNIRCDLKDSSTWKLKWRTAGAEEAIWGVLTVLTSFAVNLLPVKYYGRVEVWCGVVKMSGLVIMILAQLPMMGEPMMGEPSRGSQLWNNHANSTNFIAKTTNGLKDVFQSGNRNDSTHQFTYAGAGAGLLEVWTGITYTCFSILGIAAIPVAAAEARASAVDLKSANRKTLLRVISLTMVGVLLASFNVPHYHPNLLWFGHSASTAQSHNSLFMISAVESGRMGLANFMNAVFVFSTWSCAVSNMYVSSRTLYSLALDGHIPTKLWGVRHLKLGTTDKYGVPRNAMILCALWGLLGLMGTGHHSRSQRTLDGAIRVVSVCGLLCLGWICVTFVSYERFLETKKIGMPITHENRPKVDRDYELNPEDPGMLSAARGGGGGINTPRPLTFNVPSRTGSSELPAEADDATFIINTLPPPASLPPPPAPHTPYIPRELEAGPTIPPRTLATYAYRTRFQPARAYIGAAVVFLILVFEGWHTFGHAPAFRTTDSVVMYLTHIVFVTLWGGMKVYDGFTDGWASLWPVFQIDRARLVVREFRTGVVEIGDEDEEEDEEGDEKVGGWKKRTKKWKKRAKKIAEGVWWWIK